MLRVGGARSLVDAIQASTEHLDLKAYPSDPSASLGTRFSLAVEVRPKRSMHVYAPGATGYRVITLNIKPQPHVRTMPVQYPASEVYYFKPLDERVPVYQRPFTLVIDVVPDATAEARKALAGKSELVLDGTLEYQACDDKICYNPVSIPLSWRVALRESVPAATRPPQPTP
ncbi:MAG TPA: protein-disulfide reductase DsbD domain-containing protein [Vicinamibacterales bacterium]|nr:protein-disulfide reductase DsbD domain-containing protein [Vicinamibacterales bacterium]